MNTIIILLMWIASLLALLVVSILIWMTKTNSFFEYKKRLDEFEASRKHVKEDLENDKRRFQ